MDEPTPPKHSRICPDCGSDRITRSRRHGFKDWLRLVFLGSKPYRCRACDARFHLDRKSRHGEDELRHHRPA